MNVPKIIFIIGASGSGKTTVLKNLEKQLPEQYLLLHFDSIGVPSVDAMIAQFGSVEEWQRIKTIEWVSKICKDYSENLRVILDAQTRPSFIKEACELCDVSYEVILLDCNDIERKKRLVARGHAELANENMMNWAAFLRRECQLHNYIIIDTTTHTIDEVELILKDCLTKCLG